MSDRSRYLVPAGMAGERLDRALARLVPELSPSRLTKLVRRRGVLRNGGQLVRSNVGVQAGDLLDVDFDALCSPEPGLVLVHEDDDVAVIDKPAGLLVHANERSDGETLATLAEARFGPLPDLRGGHRPGIVHRLDRETSGLSIVALSERAMEELCCAFADRRVHKVYLALVHGVPREAEFTVDAPLEPVPGHPDLQRVAEPGTGRAAATRFFVREAFDGYALVECHPESGRRHQIRVHLKELGHPIVADRLYGSRVSDAPAGAPWPARHALHAWQLELDHPTRGDHLRLEAPLPADLVRMRDWLRRSSAPATP